MKRRWIARTLLVVGTAFVALAVYSYASYSPGGEPYITESAPAIELHVPLRSWSEHDKLYPSGTGSYVFQVTQGDGALLYYGARHSRDAKHPQRFDIEKKWREFVPTVALCEGRSRGYMTGMLFEWMSGLPEPMLVHRLVRQDGIPIYSLEPPYAVEVAGLLEQFPAELVALFFTTRVYWSESQGIPNDGLAEDLLARRTDVDGLRDSIKSVDQLDQVWKKNFPGLPEWRNRKSEPKHPLFREIGDASREIRGKHMVRTLVDLVRRGERVLAVVGCSHVIRQEPMLQAALLATDANSQSD